MWHLGSDDRRATAIGGLVCGSHPQSFKGHNKRTARDQGLSERNMGRMLSFYRNYPDFSELLPQVGTKNEPGLNLPQPVAKTDLATLLVSIPWGHHALLLEKIKSISTRFWHMEQTLQNGWSRDVLGMMIKRN